MKDAWLGHVTFRVARHPTEVRSFGRELPMVLEPRGLQILDP
jgi:hypothetical protein